MLLPVYLLVSKCDLVAGFVEMFGELRDKSAARSGASPCHLPPLWTNDRNV